MIRQPKGLREYYNMEIQKFDFFLKFEIEFWLVFWIVLKSWYQHSSRSQHAPIWRYRGCVVIPSKFEGRYLIFFFFFWKNLISVRLCALVQSIDIHVCLNIIKSVLIHAHLHFDNFILLRWHLACFIISLRVDI